MRPGRGAVTSGVARRPNVAPLVGARVKIAAIKDVKTTAGETELIGCLRRRQGVLPEALENVPDERAWVPMQELLVLFRTAEDTGRASPSGQSFRPPSLRSGVPQRLAGGAPPLAQRRAGVLLC